jgi:acetyl esterase/lipase
MKRILKKLGLMSLATTAIWAGEAIDTKLWPGVAPGGLVVNGAEEWKERGSAAHPDRSVANVSVPNLTVYLPDAESATGAAVVICPGGGYGRLAIDKEGHDVARWLAGQGIAGIVLKYRLPNGHPTVPLLDAQRAIRTSRAHADDWGLKTDRIGIMGFSAGGHLAATAATHFAKPPEAAGDAIDDLSCRPDFAMLIYPVVSLQDGVGHSGSRRSLLGKSPSSELVAAYSADLQVTAETPPTFVVHTHDDGVKIANSLRFEEACKKAGVPVETAFYSKGGHGYGIRQTSAPVSAWPSRAEAWLQTLLK